MNIMITVSHIIILLVLCYRGIDDKHTVLYCALIHGHFIVCESICNDPKPAPKNVIGKKKS